MPTKKIQIVVGEKYHVFNRGVDKRDVFLDKHDYLRFYQSLDVFNTLEATGNFRLARSQRNHTQAGSKLVQLHAYALLPNHFHLIVEPLTEVGLAEFMRRIGTGYTSYFNEKYHRTGALFQGTYKRVHVASDEHYRYLLAYVNENQIVHNLPKTTEVYQTSSFHYQGKMKSQVLNPSVPGFYDAKSGADLAREIYNRRQGQKNSDLFE